MTTGEFVPLKEDDYIIRSEMHYVIESRKVSKDIKKLKERLKKGWAHSLSLSLTSRRLSCPLTLVWLVLRRKQRSPSGIATTGRSWSILWTARYSRRGGTRGALKVC
jgi:hypothetical protein